MGESRHISVLAIDGGGTRCRIALKRGQTVTRVETGSANVSTGFDGGLAQVRAGLRALCAETGDSIEALSRLPTFVGLAGVTGPEVATRLREALPFKTLCVEDDRPAALRGALGDRAGVIAHCGTGSFFASHIDGEMRFSGGWGAIVGDEASAQWIGRMALTKVLETVDGRATPSDLSKTLLQQFDGTVGIVRFAGTASPAQFGAIAPLVNEAAKNADSLGLATMTAGAGEIARSLPLIGWAPGRTICLTGGIGPHFEPYLPAAMRANIAPPVGTPLSGALALACDLAKESPQ